MTCSGHLATCCSQNVRVLSRSVPFASRPLKLEPPSSRLEEAKVGEAKVTMNDKQVVAGTVGRLTWAMDDGLDVARAKPSHSSAAGRPMMEPIHPSREAHLTGGHHLLHWPAAHCKVLRGVPLELRLDGPARVGSCRIRSFDYVNLMQMTASLLERSSRPGGWPASWRGGLGRRVELVVRGLLPATKCGGQ